IRDARVDHDRLRLGEREMLAADLQARRLHLVAREHRRSHRRPQRAHDREVLALAPADPGGDARRGEATRCRHAHTSTPCRRSPAVSGRPRTMFAFCTAWPAAPLPRLSIAQITIVVSPFVNTPTSAASVPCTRASSGTTPSGSTRTAGLDAYAASISPRASPVVCT